MTAVVLAGGPVADAVFEWVTERAAALTAAGHKPGLATVLVGDDPSSANYVAKKHEACARCGLNSFDERLPPTATQKDLIAVIERLNADPAVDAFLVQHPVPPGFDFNQAVAAVDPGKDGDGLHPVNLGYLALGEPGRPRPCTPLGVQAMLAHYEVPVSGRKVAIVGRGPTLGRPLSVLLSLKEEGANAAVTVLHSGVPGWEEITRQADIVVGAAGVPGIIHPGVIREGSCVVGGGLTWEGRKALSDVDEACAEVAGWCTPRLGGVGVTTVAMLLSNTVRAAERHLEARA
ncbi:MAG: bifunctional 5,10-methylenetetrahydrofolate dehydrogenase/5,10-methenyltetrahydrofolate cyclohydrolase [Acidimicrobiales bacterium]